MIKCEVFHISVHTATQSQSDGMPDLAGMLRQVIEV